MPHCAKLMLCDVVFLALANWLEKPKLKQKIYEKI